MPLVPRTSPATGQPIASSSSYIHTTALNFVDASGRTLLLRGVNLSGASKAPVGRPSQVLDDFWENAERGEESFVGRPLNLEDGSADVHLARLRGWGFNLLRFPFTWEALEHEGPRKYDYAFMDYTIQVLSKCAEYGFRVYMDPHQDTWSRFSGGSGAPFWTLAACGINPQHITATQAAILHCEYPSPYAPGGPDPASLPAMVWSTNYGRLLSQTLFTLFFSGRDFAPKCIIDGVNIQDYLQSHYIEACGQLSDRIRAFEGGRLLDTCVIGWDSMNEPFEGLCGWDDLSVNPPKQGSTLKKGTYPTPAQSVRLGMGQKQTVEHWSFSAMGPKKDGVVEIDPKGRKVWADPVSIDDTDDNIDSYTMSEHPDGTHPRWGWRRDVSQWPLGTCIWALHGVWDVDTGYILRPDYFKANPLTGMEAEFLTDYWKPHWLTYAARVRRAHPEAIVFVQPPVFAIPPQFDEAELKGRCAYSPHYYDGLTLVTRHWNWFNADALGLLRGKYSSPLQAVKLGERAIRTSLYEQLGYLAADAGVLGKGGYPTLIGEIGTPFDMDGKRSYGWTEGGKARGDYARQERALDASLQACDARRKGKGKTEEGGDSLNWTVWTYVPDDHTHEWGDGWNMEDLSLFSNDDVVVSEDEDGGAVSDDDADDAMGVQGDGEDDVQDMVMDMDEDALNSRAVLLMDKHGATAARQGGMRGVMERVRRSSRTAYNQQPGRTLPMDAATSSAMSLDTLGGASTAAASAASLHQRPKQHQRQRQRQRRQQRGLNKKPSSDALSTASSSSSSSSTSSSSLSLAPLQFPTPAQRKAGFSPNPYKFLTNGARAVRAFARPWPVKVVGRAVEVGFDVGTGVFKMVVSVGWEDAVVDGEEGQERLGTEVYVPLVHYAHGRLLDGSVGEKRVGGVNERVEGEDKDKDDHGSRDMDQDQGHQQDKDEDKDEELSRSVSLSLRSGSTAVEGEVEVTPTSTSSSSKQKGSNVDDVLVTVPLAPSSPPIPPTQAPLLIPDTTPDLVDLDVRVSGGTYAVRGQTLMWWYDVPTAGEGRKEYVLEVKRKGGALGVPSWKKEGGKKVEGRGKAERERERKVEPRGWCEELCCPADGPFGCVVC